MVNNIPWNSIVKNLKGQTTPEEQVILENWLKEDESHPKILAEIQNVYSLTSSIPPYFYPDKEKAWQKIDRQTRNSGVKKKETVQPVKICRRRYSFTGKFYIVLDDPKRYAGKISAVFGNYCPRGTKNIGSVTR
ncbi:MAG: hypothetical protein ACP5D9_17560 [Mariniphaga sp.]